jgi:hypothetical protein
MKIALMAAAALGALTLAPAASAEIWLQAPAVCQAGFQAQVTDGGTTQVLRSIVAQTRTAARAMGWGGVGQYAVLPGPRAAMRVSANPHFLIEAPNNVQPQGLITVARFETRRNNTREVAVGGGYMSYSSGIPADRLVPLTIEQASSQRGATPGSIIYEVRPVAPMTPGEYALIVAIGQQAGPYGGMPGTFYDFGVDG